ncbi:MAG: histidine ammonia-lyase [Gammaproteobacteria bacterium]
MSIALNLKPGTLKLHLIEQAYRNPVTVSIDAKAKKQVDRAASVVAKAVASDEAVYGVNTGFGKLASTRIDADDIETLQRNLILSHCCGVGEPLSDEVVRLVMLLKINSLARGASGVRWEVIEQLCNMLERDVLPVIPSQGSVGASGDLAPLAHLTAAMIGEGKALFDGKEMTARKALSKADLAPLILGPKEGLGMINGTQVSCALALAGLFDAWRLLQCALVTGAMASDAMMGSTAPFRNEIHQLRGHPGQIDVGDSLRGLLNGSEIRESHREDDHRVQDPYCIRCQPQVMGACADMLRQVARTLEIEANAVTDNPLVILGDDIILSGGNFHAEPVAFAADQVALAIAEIGSIAERRIATMVDPALSYGLPAFLSSNPGLNSGFMIAEVTAAALMSENKQRAMPCSVDSTPTSANQEDHVSMACHGARRLIDMNRNLGQIVGIELLTSVQGIGFRQPLKTSQTLQDVIVFVRRHVSALENDRYMAEELQVAQDLVVSGKILRSLESYMPVLGGADQ